MIVKFIKFDIPNNTIEVSWYGGVLDGEGNIVAQESVACVNYSQ